MLGVSPSPNRYNPHLLFHTIYVMLRCHTIQYILINYQPSFCTLIYTQMQFP